MAERVPQSYENILKRNEVEPLEKGGAPAVSNTTEKTAREIEENIRRENQGLSPKYVESDPNGLNPERMEDILYEMRGELLPKVYADHLKRSEHPLSKDEKRRFLKPEVLSELGTEEYINLWRRLKPHFLTHVTRQGFREQSSAIKNDEIEAVGIYHNGLSHIGKERYLKTPFELRGLDTSNESSIRKWLSWIFKEENTEKSAKKRLYEYFHQSFSGTPKYPDGVSVHFCAMESLDSTYGAEKGNQVVLVYPSDVIASQNNYSFIAGNKDFSDTHHGGGPIKNDVFVYPSNSKGISIDAGIVFLPEKTLVDPQAGSKYESKIAEGKRIPIENEVALQNLKTRNKELRKCFEDGNSIESISSRLMEFGFDNEATSYISDRLMHDSNIYGTSHIWNTANYFESISQENLVKWKKAQDIVPAKQYWESYFKSHPDQKPKHVVFYDGDPTDAVHKFQESNGISQPVVSSEQDKLLGFDDYHVSDMEHDPRSNRGYTEFMQIAHRLIEEHYK